MKQISSLRVILCAVMLIALLITSVAIIVSATEDTASEVIDAMTEINARLGEYAVGEKTALTTDGYIGIPVEITVLFDSNGHTAVSGYESTHVILYVVNTRVERVGTESDVDIIRSMLERGYAVAVLDYKNSDKATSPALDWSAQVIRNTLKTGAYFTDKSLFPSGTYYNTYVVPAGYNVSLSNVFWEMDKHGTDGTLEKIVEIWNNDFRAIKGETLIKWTDGSGNRKATQAAPDSTSPVWLNEGGAVSESGEYIRIKHTLAEDITDCVKTDGSPIDLNLYMHLIYPASPAVEVPVMALASSAEHLANGASNSDRPHLNGFVFNGYAGVIYDFGYTPMARDDHYGYFDGSSTGSLTGDNLTYSIHFYNDKLIDTAAMRYIRYISLLRDDISIDADAIGVYGNSKGGWMTALGEPNPELLQQKRLYPGHHGETRYEVGDTATVGIIDGGEPQPWTFYGNTPLSGNAQLIYASCGGTEDLITEAHCPVFITCNTLDASCYGTMPEFVNACRVHDVPLMWFVVNIGHTLTSGNDAYYGVDTYEALFTFADYYLKGDAVSVIYIHSDADPYSGMPTSAPITVKFSGAVEASEIRKITLTSEDGAAVGGSWKAAYGNTEWTFFPDSLTGSTEYTLTVPASLAGDNGKPMGESCTYSYTTGYEIADGGGISTVTTSRGTYYYFTAPDPSTVKEFNVNRYILRLKVSNDAANRITVYRVTEFDASSPDSSAVGESVCSLPVSGAGYYDVDVTDALSDASVGDTVALLVKTDKVAGEVTVSSSALSSTLNGVSVGGQAVYTFESIDGIDALKISDLLVTNAYKHETLYNNPTTVMARYDIIGEGALEDDDLGRRFVISVSIYDTVSRNIQLQLNSCTSQKSSTIDLQRVTYNIVTVAGEWVTYNLDYTVYEPSLGNYDSKNLVFKCYNLGDESKKYPIYFSNITAKEIITDVTVVDAELLLTTTEQKENPLLTDYGAISGLYADEELFPLVSFDSNGNCIVGSATFATDSGGGALGAFSKLSETSGTILLRRNYTYNEAAYNNLSFVYGTVTIDLGGHTLTLDETHARGLFYADAKRSATTNIIIRNGSIVLGKNPLVLFGGMASGNYNYANDIKDFNFTLENVSISLSDTAAATALVSNKAESNTSPVNGSVTLIDCTVDLIGHSGFTLLNLGDSDGHTRVKATVKGGRIYADSLNSFILASVNNPSSSLALAQSQKGYTEIYVKGGTEPSEVYTVGGAPMRFEPTSTVGNYTVYSLVECALATAYGDIGAEYGSVTDYPFAVFHKAIGSDEYEFIAGLPSAFSDNLVNLCGALSGDIVILMRSDFTATECFGSVDTLCARSITYDLGDHTLTASTESATYRVEAMSSAPNSAPLDIIFTNGTVLNRGTEPFMLLGGNGTGVTGAAYNITFDGIGLVSDSELNDRPFVDFTYAATAFTASILYDGCQIDLTGKICPNGFVLFTSAGESDNINASVTVLGGTLRTVGDNISAIGLTEKDGTVTFTSGADGYFTLITTQGSPAPTWKVHTADGDLEFTLAYSTSDGDTYMPASLITAYGNIPVAYASISDFPFVLFHNAGSGYTFLAATSNAFADSYVTTYRDLAGEVVILMRRDVDLSKAGHFSNIRQVKAALVYDLGGHTLTGNTSTNYGTYFVNAIGPRHSVTEFNLTFKNGKVIVSAKPFVMIGANGAGGNGCIYNITFDGIGFVCTEGSTLVDPFVQFGGGTSSSFHANITYDDCSFDIKGSHPSSFRLFVSGTAAGVVTSTVTVKGSTVLANSSPKLTFVSGTGSSICFARSGKTGEYLTLLLPSDSIAPTGSYNSAADMALSFTKKSASSDTVAYTLSSEYDSFVPKASVSIQTDLIFNLYLPVSDALIRFSLDGVEYDNLSSLEIRESDGKKYYLVQVSLNASEAARLIPFNATVMRSDGATEELNNRLSVPEYARKLLADEISDIERALVLDLLAYIKSAYVYFTPHWDGVDEIEYERVIAVIDGIIGDRQSPAIGNAEAVRSTEGLEGARLMLGEVPYFIFYPETNTDGSLVYKAESYIFRIGDISLNSEIMTLSGRVCIKVTAPLSLMTDSICYTVDGTDISGEYNLAAYLAFAKEADGKALTALIESLWRYSESALAYLKESEAE